MARAQPGTKRGSTFAALLAHGADVSPRHLDASDPGDARAPRIWSTYLHELVQRPQADGLPLLSAALAAGADPNEFVRESGHEGTVWHGKLWTVLALACKHGNVDAVRALLAAGAHPDTPSNGDVRPVYLALSSAEAGAVHALLEAGASLALAAAGGHSLMYLATVHFSEPSVVRALLARGLSAREPPPTAIADRLTPVCYAIMHGGADMVTTLLDAGAAPDALAGAVFGRGCTPMQPLHLVCQADWGGRGTVAALLSHPSTAAAVASQINELSSDGFTPLLCAARKGHGALVSELLAAGADANVKCRRGTLALQYMQRSKRKPRNKGEPRAAEHAAALRALTAATTAPAGPAPRSADVDSDGELNHPGDIARSMTRMMTDPSAAGAGGGIGGPAAMMAAALSGAAGSPMASLLATAMQSLGGPQQSGDGSGAGEACSCM